ncbi:hypothetical protein DUI87_21358 [Hirundo rustica rustica]|uniref:Uncharacterized protein n=1 Tax=Hirundo rustica rustica TaxID=333673 RepID=A0A3M0JPI1_HIRRU|nr:hypothetical protein DUI87_21358 [Hirundo rustica rustica]
MTVRVSHQECDSLVKRDGNSLSQGTQSRGLQMQKIKIHLQEKAKKNPNFCMEKVVKDRKTEISIKPVAKEVSINLDFINDPDKPSVSCAVPFPGNSSPANLLRGTLLLRCSFSRFTAA